MRDLKNNLSITSLLDPVAKTTTFNSASVDMQDFRSLVFLLHVGVLTDGTFTPKLEESDDDSTFTDVAAADVEGTLAAAADGVSQYVGYKGVKRYARLTVTVTGSPSTGCVLGVAGIAGDGKTLPES
jgi:hypothetical protein